MMPQSYYETITELENALQVFVVVMLVIAVIFLLIALAQYIMQSIAITHIGRRRGIKQPWLIWIPVARNWAIGALADDHDARNGLTRRFRVLLLVFVLVFYGAYIILYGSIFASIPALENMGYESSEVVSTVMGLFIGMYSGMIIIVILSLAVTALNYVCLYKIYESLSPKHCVLHFILSLLIPLYMPISLLCLKNSGYPYPEEIPELPETPAETEKGWYEV